MNFYDFIYKSENPVMDAAHVAFTTWTEEDDRKHPRGGTENKGRFKDKPETIEKQDTIEVVGSGEGETVTLPSGKRIDKDFEKYYRDNKGNLHDRRWSQFLGRKVGPEMDSVLDRLFGGENVGYDEIETIPEWKEAKARAEEIERKLEARHGTKSTMGLTEAGRQKYRDNIITAATSERIGHWVEIPESGGRKFETNEGLKDGEEYEVEKGHKAFVVIGFPAAGKSTTFANPLAKKHKARLCDSDTVKKSLPEFKNGYGGNAVHEESTMINEAILNKATKRGDNVVYPILGYKPDKLKGTIDFLKNRGYEVNLCFKDMPENMAKGRLLTRFIEKGRYLPLECISKAAGKFADSWEANKDKVDGFIRTTNDKPYGGEERVLESKGMSL